MFSHPHQFAYEEPVTLASQKEKTVYPSFEEYLWQVYPFVCKTGPTIWIEIEWMNPDRFVMKDLYYGKLSPTSGTPYLVRGNCVRIMFDSRQDLVHGTKGNRPTLWKIAFLVDDQSRSIHVEPADCLPYEVFEKINLKE